MATKSSTKKAREAPELVPDPLALAQERRSQMLEILRRVRQIIDGDTNGTAEEQRMTLNACRTAMDVLASVIAFEQEHGWLPTDAGEERDWQALSTALADAARRHDLPAAVIDDLLAAVGGS